MRPMPRRTGLVVDAPRARFDVICAGEALALWNAVGMQPRLRPGGGAVNAAFALARRGLRVGLATVVADDTFGRTLTSRLAAAGVDIGGVVLAAPRTDLVVVHGTGTAGEVVSYRDDEKPVTVPAGWSSEVLLLSGLSPVVAEAAALCKAARAARRAGTIVVVDVNARWQVWAGRDSRAIRMLLREADVVRCSARDLATLHLDVADVRASSRREAVLVLTSELGDAIASGPFGEVTVRATGPRSIEEGDALTAGVCAALARAGTPGEDRADLWRRALAPSP